MLFSVTRFRFLDLCRECRLAGYALESKESFGMWKVKSELALRLCDEQMDYRLQSPVRSLKMLFSCVQNGICDVSVTCCLSVSVLHFSSARVHTRGEFCLA